MKKISFGKTNRTSSTLSSSNSVAASSSSLGSDMSISDSSDTSSTTLHPVYVGKSRRRYLLASDVVDHPILQQLAGKSAGDDEITVEGCEVVMFEHLLWMLENADPMPESLDEFVDFYAC
uniref:SAUR family protein n=2 Tax=Chenopodium quinoa TaxID=63459 RepID=A0A803M8T1_CHEQI